jgi:hypothetical protein
MIEIDAIKVISDQYEIQMIKTSELEEPLPPFKSFLDFSLAQFLIVDGDELVYKLQRVQHFMNSIWINDFGPFYLRHGLTFFVSICFIQKSDFTQQLLIYWHLCQKRP